MLIGYARVSTQDQNLELQREALSKAGCKKVFEDKVSGTRADRPGLAKTLEMLREGDTLVVWKLDRLGRSVKQLVDLVGDLHKHGVQFRSLTDSIDTGTPSGRFFFHVMASLAEMERELTVERTRAGLEVAKQLGRKGGRKPKMTDSKILTVPVGDPRYQHVTDLPSLGDHWLKEIETFFDTYKLLEPKQTEVLGWHDAAFAWKMIVRCRQRFLESGTNQ